jgi:hypothetical protein
MPSLTILAANFPPYSLRCDTGMFSIVLYSLNRQLSLGIPCKLGIFYLLLLLANNAKQETLHTFTSVPYWNAVFSSMAYIVPKDSQVLEFHANWELFLFFSLLLLLANNTNNAS